MNNERNMNTVVIVCYQKSEYFVIMSIVVPLRETSINILSFLIAVLKAGISKSFCLSLNESL